jgi:hypothetical protein
MLGHSPSRKETMNRTIRMMHVRPAPSLEVDDLAKTQQYRRGADAETLRKIARAIALRKAARLRSEKPQVSRAVELAHTRAQLQRPAEVQLFGCWVPRSWIVATAIVLTVDILMGTAALVSNYLTPLL